MGCVCWGRMYTCTCTCMHMENKRIAFGTQNSTYMYRIVGNFRELVKIRFSRRKHLRIARFCLAKGCHTPKFVEKTFAYSHKTAKFTKVFSLKSFLLYGTCPEHSTYSFAFEDGIDICGHSSVDASSSLCIST